MMIPEKLKRLIDKILFGNQSESQWLELEEEVNRYMKILSKEQRCCFEESGAGEMLSMVCAGIRYGETMRSFGVVYDENGQVLDWGQLEPGETLEYDPKTQSYKRSCELNNR